MRMAYLIWWERESGGNTGNLNFIRPLRSSGLTNFEVKYDKKRAMAIDGEASHFEVEL